MVAMTQVLNTLVRLTSAAAVAALAVVAAGAPAVAQVASANTQAIRRCEDELQFRLSREFAGRSADVIANRRRTQVRAQNRNVYEVTGTARYVRDSFDRGRAFTYTCRVNMASGQTQVQYNWSDGATFDPEYDRVDPGYPPPWQGEGLSPQGRTWFSGGIIARSSGKSLDVQNRSTQDSASVQQWDFAAAANQTWDVIELGRGEFALVSQGSNKVLDIAGGSTADGANVIQYRWHGGDNQRWRLERAGGGFFQVVNVGSGKCLDVRGNSQENGAVVQQWNCAGVPNQQFRLQGADTRAR